MSLGRGISSEGWRLSRFVLFGLQTGWIGWEDRRHSPFTNTHKAETGAIQVLFFKVNGTHYSSLAGRHISVDCFHPLLTQVLVGWESADEGKRNFNKYNYLLKNLELSQILK